LQSSEGSEQGHDVIPTNLLLNEETKDKVKEVTPFGINSNFQVLPTVNVDDAVNYLRDFVVTHK
jgi:hypothetical protein